MNTVEAAVRRLHSSFVPLARQAETLGQSETLLTADNGRHSLNHLEADAE